MSPATIRYMEKLVVNDRTGSLAATAYWQMIDGYSAEERHSLAISKRVLELIRGDPEFRSAVAARTEGATDLAAQYGVALETVELAELVTGLLSNPACVATTDPRVTLWRRFSADRARLRDHAISLASKRTVDAFDRWRDRQKSRLLSEIGEAANTVPHALVSFELAQGCSVGCSFCGVDAAKFGGAARYCEAGDEWRRMLSGLSERFGEALSSAFLYWGTDPLDNPDYQAFASDLARVTGIYPQVTTAIPLRNEALTREVLRSAIGNTAVPHRFSVLSLNVLRRILRTFAPDELLNVELVLQHKEAGGVKANAGRNTYGKANPVYIPGADGGDVLAPTTIACVTGFLVNIVERRVRLISPTVASEQWPNGYIVFEDQKYTDATSFLETIDGMLQRRSLEGIRLGSRPRFRGDLVLSREEEGFDLKSAAAVHSFRDYGALADAIRLGSLTVSEIISGADTRSSSRGEEIAFLTGVYNAGLLEVSDCC